MNAKAGSINQNRCGCGLGIFLGIQSSPGESDERPESGSSDGVQWFSRLRAWRITSGRLGKHIAEPAPRVSDSAEMRLENSHF